MVRILIVALACLAGAGTAWANPFPKGDPAKGEQLMAEAQCDACHQALFGGDGSRIYTRPDRRVSNPSQLRAQVRFCATQVKANWFPEEEEHVAAYLNQRYYRFK
jgi:hypothetical protein